MHHEEPLDTAIIRLWQSLRDRYEWVYRPEFADFVPRIIERINPPPTHGHVREEVSHDWCIHIRGRATGDEATLNAVFADVHRCVLQLARKKVFDQDFQEDVAQKTMVACLIERPPVKKTRAYIAWLAQRVLDFSTKRKGEEANGIPISSFDESAQERYFADPAHVEELLSSEEALLRCMQALNVDQRMIFLYHLQGYNVQEIADRLNRKHYWVRPRLAQVIAICRQILSGEGDV